MLMANQKDRTELLQAMLQQVGFTVEFDMVDSAAWNKKGAAYDYDILIGTMTGIFDPDRPYGYLEKASGSNWLVGGYDSPQMSDLLAKGRAESDVNKRKEIYKQVVQLVQDDAADQLDVEVAHPQDAPAGLTDDGEGLRHEVVQGCALRQALLELQGPGGQRTVVQDPHRRLQRADLLDDRPDAFQLALVLGAYDAGEDGVDHAGLSLLR